MNTDYNSNSTCTASFNKAIASLTTQYTVGPRARTEQVCVCVCVGGDVVMYHSSHLELPQFPERAVHHAWTYMLRICTNTITVGEWGTLVKGVELYTAT